jgi:hypothetical protein
LKVTTSASADRVTRLWAGTSAALATVKRTVSQVVEPTRFADVLAAQLLDADVTKREFH